MMKLRRFKAFYIRTGEDVGIGITEHTNKWDSETIAIHSIYDKNNLSNRDAFIAILQEIYFDLADDELALLYMSQTSRGKGWKEPYANRIKISKASYVRGVVYQTQLLAQDALRRESTISEVFDEPIRFSTITHEKEEREN